MLEDVTTAALHATLRGLSARQRVIADNVANVETPGFTAGTVNFESALAGALAAGRDPSAVLPSFGRSPVAPGPNGNNVNLDDETIDLMKTVMRYQLGVESVNNKFRLLRTAINGQAG